MQVEVDEHAADPVDVARTLEGAFLTGIEKGVKRFHIGTQRLAHADEDGPIGAGVNALLVEGMHLHLADISDLLPGVREL